MKNKISLTLDGIIRDRRLGPIHIGMTYDELFSRYLEFDETRWAGHAGSCAWGVFWIEDIEISFGTAAGGAVPIIGFVLLPGATVKGQFSGGGVFSLDSEGLDFRRPLPEMETTLARYGFRRLPPHVGTDDEVYFETESKVTAAFDIQDDGVATFTKLLVF